MIETGECPVAHFVKQIPISEVFVLSNYQQPIQLVSDPQLLYQTDDIGEELTLHFIGKDGVPLQWVTVKRTRMSQ